ncbi:MAG: helix-turn-helix domain-containing protein [Pseudomonadota bacterium]
MFHFTSDKRGEILAASITVFATYGFRKTSMDDLAKAAGVSRPALYQVFKNKTDIFRALSFFMLERAEEVAKTELDGDGAFPDRLIRSVDRSILDVMRLLDDSPHGADLIGVNDQIASDIDREWHRRMSVIFGGAIEAAIVAGEIAPLPIEDGQIGRLFSQFMEGTRREHANAEKMREDIVSFIALIASKPASTP